MRPDNYDDLPDARDGLTRKERIVLYCIEQIQKERGGRNVPTAIRYGRVVEHVNISVGELQQILQRLLGDRGQWGSDAMAGARQAYQPFHRLIRWSARSACRLAQLPSGNKECRDKYQRQKYRGAYGTLQPGGHIQSD